MRVTVLGKSPSWQDADGACSGYLVQEDDYALLLDCGNGVFSKLRRFSDYVEVGAVADQPPARRPLPRPRPVRLRADLRSAPAAGARSGAGPARAIRRGPQLHAPVGSGELFRQLVGCWGNEELIDRAFELHEYDSPDELELGPFAVRFCEVPHYTPTYAVELSASRGRFTYSADCSPNDEIVRFAADTDLLLIEATLPRPERTGIRGHLTPREAGEHGRAAGARRLVITHFSDELDADWARAEASSGFGGPVELAREGAVFTL